MSQLSRKMSRVLAITAIAATVAGISASPASAETDPQTQQYVSILTANLTAHGVAPDVQAQLVAKFLKGVLPDSDTGKASPVSTTEKSEGGKLVTRYVYADGSVAVGTVEQPPVEQAGRSNPRAIAGCHHTVDRDVNTFTGCEAGLSFNTWGMSYYADFGYYQFGSWMRNFRGLTMSGAGTFTDRSLDIIQSSCNSACDSWGRGTATQNWTVAGVGVSRLIGVRLRENNSNRKNGATDAIG